MAADTAPDLVTACLAEIEARNERSLGPSITALPVSIAAVRALMESAADVPRLIAAVRAGHDDLPVYCGADDCEHPMPPALTSAGNEWDRNHPLGEGDVGRICLLTEVGRYCPACTTLVYQDDPVGDSYVSAGNCIVRPAITAAAVAEYNDELSYLSSL